MEYLHTVDLFGPMLGFQVVPNYHSEIKLNRDKYQCCHSKDEVYDDVAILIAQLLNLLDSRKDHCKNEKISENGLGQKDSAVHSCVLGVAFHLPRVKNSYIR